MAMSAETVSKRNKAAGRIPDKRAAATARVYREPHHGIVVDIIKSGGRRYGPTPLRLLLPPSVAAPAPMDARKRLAVYTTRRGSWALTSRQRRRSAKKSWRAAPAEVA